jgi:ribosomal protein S12 methylthiotransferase
MEAQQAISLRKNRALVGSVQRVLIEGIGEIEDDAGRSEPVAVGRAARHAPEVDGLVFVPGNLRVGEMIDVRITDASHYDLWGLPDLDHGASQDGGHRSRPNRDRVRRRRPVPMAIPTGT